MKLKTPDLQEKTYKFSDLDTEAKETAIREAREDAFNYDWWQFVYEDAEQIGLKIEEFDVSYRQSIDGKLEADVIEIIKNIKKIHGRKTNSYKLAQTWHKKLNIDLVKARIVDNEKCVLCDNDASYNNVYCEYCYEDDIKDKFKKELLQIYWQHLKDECDYLESDEAIIETIENNDYEYDEYGNRI